MSSGQKKQGVEKQAPLKLWKIIEPRSTPPLLFLPRSQNWLIEPCMHASDFMNHNCGPPLSTFFDMTVIRAPERISALSAPQISSMKRWSNRKTMIIKTSSSR